MGMEWLSGGGSCGNGRGKSDQNPGILELRGLNFEIDAHSFSPNLSQIKIRGACREIDLGILKRQQRCVERRNDTGQCVFRVAENSVEGVNAVARIGSSGFLSLLNFLEKVFFYRFALSGCLS